MTNTFNIEANKSNKVRDEKGVEYRSVRALASALGISKSTILKRFHRGESFKYKGHTYDLIQVISTSSQLTGETVNEVAAYSKEYEEFLRAKNVEQLPFVKCDFKFSKHANGNRYAVALFSDAHIEETVFPASVMGLNEYNINIAKKRIEKYFVNLASCLRRDAVNGLIFASLGDTISGYIHDELQQSNAMTPLEATFEAQNLLYAGLKYICDNVKTLSYIKFIGIVGNHSRTTKKIQHANGYKMSFEWLMYKNVEKECKLAKLPIDFDIPESEMAIVDTDDKKRFIFIHGFQLKGGNGSVCGIYPSLNRLALKYGKVFKQDKVYLGHFHSCVSLTNAVVNGSIIGYNSYALTNGFAYEEPAQMYEVYDSEIGLLLTRQIYCK